MVKIYTMEEFHAKLTAECATGPVVNVGDAEFKAGVPAMIKGIECEEHAGMPCLVLYHLGADGEEYGVIIDRDYALHLVEQLGPHPMVEEFFKLH